MLELVALSAPCVFFPLPPECMILAAEVPQGGAPFGPQTMGSGNPMALDGHLPLSLLWELGLLLFVARQIVWRYKSINFAAP